MAAEDFFVHREQDTCNEEDPETDSARRAGRFHSDRPGRRVTASAYYRAEHAPALATAILAAMNLDPRRVFAGEPPELNP
ncbi:hypothetical protein ACFFGR_05465 [Arthrobacter liuii]|uniref:Uncharacterized protein n=1 Tax=Arthrobacter liuii TaxID=1476996 RepID=A0ABQ2AIF0_9MICC|nr:hypothetical protein [Arthrobacter liuii]GGH91641.1 hypothetical protein GCM10007170_08270 [Arthrobacter liuii]